ncbi:MAG: efflux RND transporter periplasmic adaptor subunit [Candidatus Paracaedibacteraceae bacterium]|nr:efflux RND transporter periplasmic adaptor subunit [Candidatus Paracaedibacteraceae bacterium]
MTKNEAATIESKAFDVSAAHAKRRYLFKVLAFVVGISAVSFGAYYYFFLSHYVSTDNAYVSAEVAQVTPSIGGTVKEIRFNDTDIVKEGDVLVVIDDIDAKLALANADAQLAKAQVELEHTKLDYERRVALAKSGSVSGEELSNSSNAFKTAQAIYNIDLVAKEKAVVDLNRTVVKAPVDGIVAKRQVQLGQRVQPGTPLMSIVPVHKLHVDANFKEVQLEHVKVGQPVRVISDFYDKAVVYQGKVAGIAGGTGAAFAVLPAQNATGNWIKVVQRLPVRIQLDPEDLKKNPLKVGLSMFVEIDISKPKT